jgi:hypothetical protein
LRLLFFAPLRLCVRPSLLDFFGLHEFLSLRGKTIHNA